MRVLSIVIVVAALLAAWPGVPSAQPHSSATETTALKLERWGAEADLIDGILKDGTPGISEVDSLRASVDAQRAEIPEAIAVIEAELAPLRQQLEALGPAPEDKAQETPEVAAQRASLTERVAAIEGRLKQLDAASARAAAQLAQLTELRRHLFSRVLLTRGPSVLDAWVPGSAIKSIGEVARAIRGEIVGNYAASRMDVSYFIRVLLPLGLVGAALFLVVGVKRTVLRLLLRPLGPEATQTRRVTLGFAVTFVRLLIPSIALAMALFAMWHSRIIGPRGETLLDGITLASLILIGAYALSAAFYAPHTPQLRLSRLPGSEARPAYRWLMSLASIVAIDRIAVVQGEAVGLTVEALTVLNATLLVFGGVAIWAFARYLRPAADAIADLPQADDDEDGVQAPRRAFSIQHMMGMGVVLLARAVALVAPALALMGYFAASHFLFYGVVLSGGVIGFCILLFHVVQDTVDRIVSTGDETRPAQESRVRLIPVAVAFLLTCAAVPVLAVVWGADTTDLSAGWRTVSEGFKVGDVVISPLDFFGFLLVFSICYVLTRIVQGILTRSVLPYSGLDAGGKAAVRAGVFYVGVFLSALVAISATGLDLSSLAIVAGALSVGIGFGLQNIVNNFVSGIILLIERPIKAGDWVQLGSGTGYVKQVNVRSTEIETFDRSSLIVPNSELISGPVTNYTHNNLNGRVIVPIGVAYGTDPRKVETILTEIAAAHPMLLRRPVPYVLFRRFGADALEFEIRGVLRDVNWILNVTSDINYEIARRFAEAGIEIPFAQRDLHLRNAGELGESIASAMKGKSARQAPQAPAPEGKPGRRRPSSAAGLDADGDT